MTTLREAVEAVLGGPTGRTGPTGPTADRITWETVSSVTSRQECVVLGRTLPITGLATVVAGARVPVAWKNGQPVAVIAHRWRRAQFHPSFRVGVKGIVEELLIAAVENQAATVWYRNHAVVEAVTDANGTPIRILLDGHKPLNVKWGLDGKSFAVQCEQDFYAVFTFDRTDPNVVDDQAPWAATRRYLGKPLDSSTVLTSVSFKSETTYLDKCFTCQEEWVYTWQEEPQAYFLTAINGSFLTDVDGGGSASGSTAYPVPLNALLAGTLRDADGDATISGSVVDWYLDQNLELQFLIRVNWDYFRMEAENSGGSRTTYTSFSEGGAQDLEELRAIVGSFSGGVAGNYLGAKKVSLETISESHLFLFNGSRGQIDWATASAVNEIGFVNKNFSADRFLRGVTVSAGGPDPHTVVAWYHGANVGGDLGDKVIDKGNFYQGSEPTGKTNQQILDQASALFPGPYVSIADAGMGATYASMLGRWYWRWDYALGGKTCQRLWFYRVASSQLYTVRVRKGTDQAPIYVDEPRLFLVIERYPFIGGTNYINDLPEIGVFVTLADGTLVKTLRAYQAGLSGAILLSGNGHRLLWKLGVGAVIPVWSVIATSLDLDVEVQFTAAQWEAWTKRDAALYPPDFIWDRADPQAFYEPKQLPAIATADDLEQYAGLATLENPPRGSVRITNDEEILAPLDRYQGA